MSVGRHLSSEHQSVLGTFLEIVQPSLGTTESTKCVLDQGDEENAVFIRDAYLLLRSLHIHHPTGQVVVEVCKAHRELYGCGVKSLLFFMGHLSKRAERLRDQGIPLCYIEDLMHEAVEDCIRQVDSLVIPVRVDSGSEEGCALPSASAAADHDPSSCTKPETLRVLESNSPQSHRVVPPQGEAETDRIPTFPHQPQTQPLLMKPQTQPLLMKPQTQPLLMEPQTQPLLMKPQTQPLLMEPQTQPLLMEPQTQLHVLSPSCNIQRRLVPSTSAAGSPFRSSFTPSLLSSAGGVAQTQTRQDEISRRLEELLLFPNRKTNTSKELHRRGMLSSRHFNHKVNAGSGQNGIDHMFQAASDFPGDHVQHVDSQTGTVPQAGTSFKTECSTSDQTVTIPHLGTLSNSSSHSVQPQSLSQVSDHSSREHASPALILPEASRRLNHGSEEAMHWAGKVMAQQCAKGYQTSYNLNLVHTCSLSGRSRHEVISGLVVRVDQQVLEYVSKSRDRSFTAMLINADLTKESKHKGFKQTLNVRTVITDSVPTGELKWASEVMALLEDMNVTVVLVRGKADPILKDLCLAGGIAVLEMVPYHALDVLQTACNVELTTYVLESTARNVCTGLMLKPLLEDWMDSLDADTNYLVIMCPTAEVQTLVIRHPSTAWREVFEQEFWLCANRLAQAVKDMKVLPGGGMTELWCGCQHLSSSGLASSAGQSVQDGDLSLYRPVVRAAVAETFMAFASTVHQNRERIGKSGPEGQRSESGRLPNSSSDVKERPQISKDLSMNVLSSVYNTYGISGDDTFLSPGADSGLFMPDGSVIPSDSSAVASDQAGGSTKISTLTTEAGPIDQYDNYACKISSWRSAVSCICMVMKVDMHITTGVDKYTAPVDSILL